MKQIIDFCCVNVRDFEPKILIKGVYVTVLLCILYSIEVHVESQKYKMICLNSPKSEFAKWI